MTIQSSQRPRPGMPGRGITKFNFYSEPASNAISDQTHLTAEHLGGTRAICVFHEHHQGPRLAVLVCSVVWFMELSYLEFRFVYIRRSAISLPIAFPNTRYPSSVK